MIRLETLIEPKFLNSSFSSSSSYRNQTTPCRAIRGNRICLGLFNMGPACGKAELWLSPLFKVLQFKSSGEILMKFRGILVFW